MNGTASNYAGQNYADNGPTASRPSTHLESIVTRLASMAGDVRTVDRDLQAVHDRAFGSSPEGKEVGGARGPLRYPWCTVGSP